eukprot:CAMPEP_0185022386 /NCGR_PEP_ID=MMETSP1103-20130426/5101_1 /TAXON_ID=36769 /ORGANISM="Paraphysomonas bandaiensis, Strain Caron Lab Isolate" /LENGTH=663 /DNA_ID=CAMNT_0027554433 /DNA_START=93 /DNA_END=2084 /DNA_ORIENTATION=-
MVKPRTGTLGTTNTQIHTRHKSGVFDIHDSIKPPVKPVRTGHHLTRLNETSTWKVEARNIPEYTTEKLTQYTDPKTRHMESAKIKPPDYEAQRESLRMKAVDKFEMLAKKRYGSMKGLFTALKKDATSKLTLDEFSEHLRKRNMDLYFPRDEQRLLFELFDKDHSNRVQISDLLEHSQSMDDSSIPSGTRWKSETKDLIFSKIDEQRGKEKLVQSPRQTKLQLVRTLRNLDPRSTGYVDKDQLKWALGPGYLNLNLTDEEIQAAVDLCPPSSRTGKISYDKFVRVLDIRNTDPIADPFFDARANQITMLKKRLATLDAVANDKDLLDRRDELLKVCMVGPGESGLAAFLDPMRTAPTTTQSSSLRMGSPEKEALEDMDQGRRAPPRLSHRQSSFNIDTTHYEEPEDDEQVDASGRRHFRATMNHPSRSRVKYPMTVDLAQAHSEHRESIPGGRRRGPDAVTDWGIIQHDSSYPPSPDTRPATSSMLATSKSLSALETDSRYRSTQSEYYTPLEYKPSMPVTRPHVIGDAMRCAMEREERRRKRYERTQANMNAVSNYVELERISQTLNESLRAKGRVKEALHYESAAFHEDIKTYSRRPGHHMQRKPNPELFNKMWGGNLQHDKKVVEDRDFSTTYARSFMYPSESTPASSGRSVDPESFPVV